MQESKRIGLMGGAFDPIHIGHLVTAEEARFQFGLEQVVFIPSGIPAHKEAHSLVAAELRLQMTELATHDNPHFSVSRHEVDKVQVSYTVDTMAAMHGQYPEAEIYFITGADAVLEILTWKEPWRIYDYGFLIAATRPGYDLARLNELLAQNREIERLRDKVLTMTVPALAISSTDIRLRIAQSRPVRYLVPRAVEEFIITKRLYG